MIGPDRYIVVRMYDPRPYGVYDNEEGRIVATSHDFGALTQLVKLLSTGTIHFPAPDAPDPTRDDA